MRLQSIGALAFTIAFGAASAACGHGPSASQGRANTPPETQTAIKSDVPMTTTVTGCLAAGEAGDTFVLNAGRAQGAATTATYNLVGANNDQLRRHVGEQVQVSGTVTSGTQVAEQSMPQVEANKPKATSGTPVVQTKTDVQIQRLSVASVVPQNQKCQ